MSEKIIKIKSFTVKVVLRQSVLRVFGPHLLVIKPASNIASFKEMSRRWRAVGNTVSDLTEPRFESCSSRFKNERVIPFNQLAGWSAST